MASFFDGLSEEEAQELRETINQNKKVIYYDTLIMLY
jgi:hypothetical protein